MTAAYSTFGELAIGDSFFFVRRSGPGGLYMKQDSTTAKNNAPHLKDKSGVKPDAAVMVHPESVT